ncbi:trypsin-like peptidase domain-containing protein [Streptomyces physcomitrii]|uniref:S1C family serine protease n=1 Tax=Streptomyces physcomitrii TaxID=2724184 RepID=UPI00343CC8A3
MNENTRQSGAYDQDGPEGSSHSEQYGPGPGAPQGGYPPRPAHEPAGHRATGGGTHAWPSQPGWGGQSGWSGHGGQGGSGTDGGVGGGVPVGGHGERRRARRPVALFAAVALVAAAVGGGTAYAVQELNDSGQATATSATGTVNGTSVATSSKGTVAGVAAAVSPSIVEVTASAQGGKSTGSGVIVTADGEIVTNNHVVAGASSVKVTTNDGKSYRAEVVGTDSKKDLALLKASGAPKLKPASLGDSSDLQVGQDVVAIGSPEGLSGTVTRGIVSALDRDVTVASEQEQQPQTPGPGDGWPFEFGGRQFNGDTGSSTTTYKAIQTDASLNPGNSGGALINMNGEIIGINSAMYAPSSSSGGSGDSGSAGLGFAIPVNTVKADLDQLRSGASS